MEKLGACFLPKEITCNRIDNLDKERQTLAQLALIVRLVQEAFKAFAEKKLQKFDALVGETSCQLRASAVQGLAYDPDTVEKLTDSNVGANLEALIEKVKALFKSGCADLFKEPPMHAQFCQKVVREAIRTCKLPLDRGSCFLILSHTLYLTRDAANSQKTNPFQLSVLLPDEMKQVLPTTFYEKMVLCAKRCLAHDSVESVIALAKKHGELRRLVLERSVKDSCELKCAPCFPSIDVILEEVRQKGRPLAILIKREGERMLIPFAAIEGTHVLVEKDALGGEPVLIFEGVSTHKGDFVRDLLEQDPFPRICEFIRMNAAAHPQYAGSHKKSSVTFLQIGKEFGDKIKKEVDPSSHTVEQVAQIMQKHCDRHELQVAQRRCHPASLEGVVMEYLRLEVLKGLASERGCTRENPTVFALQHIYCSTVGDVLKEHQVILDEEEE